ncbi:MAG: low molecular weight protein-tyrosine-phosphatase [Marinifilaceae bacterium]
MEKKYKLLFVCLGNICRSPSAEGIMRQLVEDKGCAEAFDIDSAGTYGGHAGALPDERMRRHASKRGYVLDSRSRQFYPSADFERFDLIICMDNENVHNIMRLAETDEERAKVVKMTDFCSHYKHYTEVPDPYYGGAAGFELVLDLLEDATEGLYEHLVKK